MTALTLLLITSITEHVVVAAHGEGYKVAFTIGFVLQLAYAVWGFMIGDTLFGTTGITLAILNLFYHVKHNRYVFRRSMVKEIDNINTNLY